MIIGEKIATKDFKAAKMKDAYLEACKWVSTNIVAKNNSNHITYRIIKTKQSALSNIVTAEIYLYVDEEEVHTRHCNICKELAKGLYMKENKFRCEVCKVNPYRERIQKQIEEIRAGIKGVIDI